MDIRTALTNLIAIQAAVTITVPGAHTVAVAYKYFPPQDVAVAEIFFQNDWALVTEERLNGMHRQHYIVHSQLFVTESDMDQAADIATAMMADYVDRLDADITLGGAVTNSELRGGSPTMGTLRRGSLEYMGLDLFLDLILAEGKTFT